MRGGRLGRAAALCAAAGLLSALAPHHGHAYLVWQSGAAARSARLLHCDSLCPPRPLLLRSGSPSARSGLKLRSQLCAPHVAVVQAMLGAMRVRSHATRGLA